MTTRQEEQAKDYIAANITLEDFAAWCEGELTIHLNQILEHAGVISLELSYFGGLPAQNTSQIYISSIETI